MRKSLLLRGSILPALAISIASASPSEIERSFMQLVAVGQCREAAYLTTPLSSRGWREFRKVALPSGMSVGALSASGTKLLVSSSDAFEILDLVNQRVATRHVLPGDYELTAPPFRLINLGSVSGKSVDSDLSDAEFAAVLETRAVIVLTRNGKLKLQEKFIEFDAHSVIGREVRGLHARRGGFSLVEQLSNGTTELSRFTVAHAGANKIERTDYYTFSSPLAAELAAVLPVERKLTETDLDKIRELAAALGSPAGCASNEVKWQFREVRPKLELYAPVLEFAPDEHVFPSTVEMWTQLKSNGTDRKARLSGTPRSGRADRKRAELDQYNEYKVIPTERKLAEFPPVAYSRVHSDYPGTWLLEYWFYYPFDVGKVGAHAHDPEHLFVEVDRVGGIPRAILAAGHSRLTPNNLFSNIDRDTDVELTLPLYGFVELAKHAMAPDTNGDGVFTFGRDVNMYSEYSQLWGIRDFIGRNEAHMMAYEASMTMPRKPEDELPVKGFSEIFWVQRGRGWEPLKGDVCSRAYSIKALSTLPRYYQKCKGLSPACAASTIDSHDDAKDARNIYKQHLFPRRQIRTGLGWSFGDPSPQVHIAGAADLFPIGEKFRVPIPGRIVGEVTVSGWRRDLLLANYSEKSRVESYGVRYEKPLTGLMGIHFSGNYTRRRISARGVEDEELDIFWERNVKWRWGAGIFFEFSPPWIKAIARRYRSTTVLVHLGPTWGSRRDILRVPSAPVGPTFEIRASYVAWSSRGRSTFGIRKERRKR